MRLFWSAVRQTWAGARWFRIVLIIALIWTILRLGLQASVLLAGEENQAAIDLQVYVDASRHFAERADLYPESLEVLEYHFPYPPTFAFLFSPLTWLPGRANIVLHLLLRILAYIALFAAWQRIFCFCKLDRAARMLLLTLPVWLVYSPFWDDLGYINIYTVMALLGTLLVEAVLKKDLPRSILWLTLILITKPQWAFAAAVPLILGQGRFFLRMLAGALACYLVLAGVTALAGGPAYVWAQFREYASLLGRLGNEFPWRGPGSGFLGYNHSVKQTFAYFLGPSETVLSLATGLKLGLLVPLGIVAFKMFRRRSQVEPPAALELACLLYLGAFIWLDILWEAFLAIAVYACLFPTLTSKAGRAVLGVLFLAYALLDPFRAVLYVAGSPMAQDSYFLWDYSVYLPVILIVILALYFPLLVRRLRG